MNSVAAGLLGQWMSGPLSQVLAWVLLGAMAASPVFAGFGAIDVRSILWLRGIREPRISKPLVGKIAFWFAVGATLGIGAFLLSFGILVGVVVMCLPTWLALVWSPLLPRKRRVRDLLFTLAPTYLLPLFGVLYFRDWRWYLVVAWPFLATMAAALLVMLTPRQAVLPRATGDATGGPSGVAGA